ncbi:hypothetical protein [uncultured Kordia sp.]|uniref:hypothetical protein n=1 Tax=uncultured Kordia sp. TaxID=507699 RepID=UPI0026360387|nr:hypothetical protein [uncultured Kordia sp.]
MKQQILSIGKELTKSEQRTINGGFGEECERLLGACTIDADCHNVNFGFQAFCEFGCCVTPI